MDAVDELDELVEVNVELLEELVELVELVKLELDDEFGKNKGARPKSSVGVRPFESINRKDVSALFDGSLSGSLISRPIKPASLFAKS